MLQHEDNHTADMRASSVPVCSLYAGSPDRFCSNLSEEDEGTGASAKRQQEDLDTDCLKNVQPNHSPIWNGFKIQRGLSSVPL